MLRTLAARAASGNVPATKVLLDLVMGIFGPDDRGSKRQALSKHDQELFDRLLARAADESLNDSDDPDDQAAANDDEEEPGE